MKTGKYLAEFKSQSSLILQVLNSKVKFLQMRMLLPLSSKSKIGDKVRLTGILYFCSAMVNPNFIYNSFIAIIALRHVTQEVFLPPQSGFRISIIGIPSNTSVVPSVITEELDVVACEDENVSETVCRNAEQWLLIKSLEQTNRDRSPGAEVRDVVTILKFKRKL